MNPYVGATMQPHIASTHECLAHKLLTYGRLRRSSLPEVNKNNDQTSELQISIVWTRKGQYSHKILMSPSRLQGKVTLEDW